MMLSVIRMNTGLLLISGRRATRPCSSRIAHGALLRVDRARSLGRNRDATLLSRSAPN